MSFDAKYKKKYNFSDGSDLLDLIQNHTNTDAAIVRTSGNQTINGVKTFTSDIQGTAVKAKYADLAENYISDKNYIPGTLICFNGDDEITLAREYANGVISDKPAVLLNSQSEGLPVALAGKVKIRVRGIVDKFNKIKLDPDHPGVGIATYNDEDEYIARALEKKSDKKEGLVLCVTQFKI